MYPEYKLNKQGDNTQLYFIPWANCFVYQSEFSSGTKDFSQHGLGLTFFNYFKK